MRDFQPAPRGLALAVLAIALCVYVTTTGGSFATDVASYEVTKNLVEHRTTAMSYNVLDTDAEKGTDGRYYAPVGLGHPLFGIPFYVGARALQALTGIGLGKPDSLTKAAVVVGSSVAAALSVALCFLFAWRLTGDARRSVQTAFLFGFATSLWPYSKFGFNAPLATLCLLGSAHAAWMGMRFKRRGLLVAAGAWLAYGLLTRHELLLAVGPTVLWVVLESRRDRRTLTKSLVAFAVPVALGFLLWCSYNYIRFGHPFDTGLLRDPNVRFDTPLLLGLHGLLLSPGRGLLLYSPIVIAGASALVWLSRRDRSTAAFFAAQVLVFLLLIARMHQWDGGESYGPRYLVPVVSFLVLPLAPALAHWRFRWRNSLLLPLVMASVAVQVPGVLVDFSKVQQAFARSRPGYSIAMSRDTWEAAPLVLNSKAALEAVPHNIRYLSGREVRPAVRLSGGESDHAFSHQLAFSLDFWWLYLYYLGAVPAWLAVLIGLAPLIGAVPMTAWLFTRLRQAGSPPS